MKSFYIRLTINLFSVLLFLVLLTGCPRPKSISSQYEILPEKPDGFMVSKRVLLVADNQLNHLYGDPIWLRNKLFDKIVPVTIRPVQQDLFGQDLLKWVLQNYPTKPNYHVIHLGDATNLACEGEFKSFLEIMGFNRNPWVMVPGNHDAYLLGNFHNTKKDWWNRACLRADGPMTKDRFIEMYLDYLGTQNSDFGTYFNTHSESGEWHSKGEEGTFLCGIAYNIDTEHPYRSYLIQQVNLTGLGTSSLPVSAILMDSTQYHNRPTLIPVPLYSVNAGLSGSMLSDQLSIADRWLQSGALENNITILMVHHPYGTLVKKAKKGIDHFRKKYNISLYVSGHTHHGEFFARGGDEGWLELNVGSIVDWPIEFRTLEVHENMSDPKKLVFRTRLFRIPEIWNCTLGSQKPISRLEWEIKEANAKDFYLAHNYKSDPNPKKTQKDLLVALLLTYERLIEAVETTHDNTEWPCQCKSDADVLTKIKRGIVSGDLDLMTQLLIELETFDKERIVADPVAHRDYRLYQAVWASKYDNLEGRKPIVQDTYIQFEKEGDNE